MSDVQTIAKPNRFRTLFLSRSLFIGSLITVILVAMALVSYFWTPYSPTAMNFRDKLQGPSFSHFFGTDNFGRDVFSMIMVGARNSIAVSIIAVLVGAGLGIPLGAFAAARGGMVDGFVMRMTDLAFAFPALLTAVIITAIFGPGAVNAMIAIGIFNIPVFARVTRGASLGLWKREYVQAARCAGRGDISITILHVLPNINHVLIVQATIQFALAIVAEAGLSYVGLGTQPPMPSWGKMLNDAQTFIYDAPWLAIFPGLAITLAVLGLNMLGDGLRDVLDPRVRRQR
ncbi:ABC transporter permease [Brucella pituitosa]|uniref:ABC transporter permease n=2 Tax=Brucella TaxID=234 RepID=A0A643EXJ0_9HYPH|nr:ABC transporter permease [Brucella pituitosa]PQZ50525.1 peptide ABC transporter permease [Ochrobactrum sp. MYb19]PRA55487.1 peptide ABC transporter permease [Ochrobactrum sp. MYb68]PRA68564.1 peptide ABC transporter permease [Ochrobactrum sp. MYb18]PRA74208.1 peptide ABC transporter permease [Brucella thiophenivorans]PRA82649.1 peptide ABC transporter permease [Ochrobactrum sp. MYb29]PRA90816.1 peptide ABC transporter permease [Ochrobactrum sp. MYb14]PRA96267.1 peptide ABC transporter per